MVSDGVRAGDLFVADEVFVGVEDAVADGDDEVVDGETPWRGRGVEGDELTHDALVGVGGNASLSAGAARGKDGGCEDQEDDQEEELGSAVHGATSRYWSRKRNQFWLQKDRFKDCAITLQRRPTDGHRSKGGDFCQP